MGIPPDDGRQHETESEKNMSSVFRNTFGSEGLEVYTYKDNYHFLVMRALIERGYADVQGSTLRDDSWMASDGGYIVHATLEKGGKAILFMARTMEVIEKVTEALKLSTPGIALHEPVKVTRPE